MRVPPTIAARSRRDRVGSSKDAIVGREAEFASVSRFLEDAQSEARILLLEGEPGIGKTTLWLAGVDLARDAGHRVMSSQPAEIETSFSYAALGDLLADVLDETLDAMPDPQRRALEVALLRHESDAPPPDRRAVALAFLRALESLGSMRPVLVAVDDAQWLDRPSAQVLAFAIRRLPPGVKVLASLRVAPGIRDPLDLRRSTHDRTLRLRLGPIGVSDLARLIHGRLGRSLSRPLVSRIHQGSGGNPFFALEVARALDRRDPAHGEPLPIPDEIKDVLVARVKRLSVRARDVVLLASAMARPTIGSLVRARADSETGGLEEAEEAGIVDFEGDRVRFAHPLLASAVYWSAPDARRRRAHARLAEIATDLEERARHLALAGGAADEHVASLGEAAAGEAMRRGAPLAAAELFELAYERTPVEHGDRRCRRGRLAAGNHFAAGNPVRAQEMLTSQLEAGPAGVERAGAAYELSTMYWNDVGRARELLVLAVDEGGGDPNLLARAWSDLAYTEVHGGSLGVAARHAARAVAFAEPLEDRFAIRYALGTLGTVRALMGRDARGLMDRALSELSRDRRIRTIETGEAKELLARHIMWAGDLEAARRLFLEALGDLTDQGHELLRWEALLYLAELECRAGRWAEATALVDESQEIVADAGLDALGQVLFVRALVEALRGEADAAMSHAAEGLSRSEAQANLIFAVRNRAVLGFVELSLGRHAEAVEMMDSIPQTLEAMGVRESGAFPFLPDLIESLLVLGEMDHALALVERLEEQGRAHDRPLALATAARCRALAAATAGDLARAERELDLAVTEHARIPMPFELARTLLVRGDVFRRMKQKRAARGSLEEAARIFETLGALIWLEKTRSALSRVGGRAGSSSELTATERQVADLVAAGRRNKEVADELFITVKTVEANLRRVYQKLGVRSRTELAGRLLAAADADRQT
jgi:DNA-binding CsgD family transcriptional regulator